MTTQDLYAALAPIALHFTADAMELEDSDDHIAIHSANSVLLFLVTALERANAGQPELLILLCRRAGIVPGILDHLPPSTFDGLPRN